jgi:hypothetical protein
VLFPKTDGIDAEWVDGNPVIPLDTAVDQMMENPVPFRVFKTG